MNNKTFLLLLLTALLFHSCKAQQKSKDGEKHAYTNSLVNESSPYLLQHAHNPVDWHPWGDEALKKANDEQKLIVISIGYAACHWCHVMEHESFEDTTVAKLMNDNFMSIKVDREERPDVDQVYMDAVHLMNGRGGWPLNAIALPDGRPIFAGTYFPKEKWIQVLNYFLKLYKEEPEKVLEQAQKITEGVQQMELIPIKEAPAAFSQNDLDGYFASWEAFLDFDKGGKAKAPKFPMPNNYQALLRYHHLTNNTKALKAVTVTLDNMSFGGIYDHLGGGFARYSTDAIWLVPHFEKMLYDNGQLVSLYAEAYQLNPNEWYKKVVYQSLEFVARELTSPEGGFYSSLDADSDGEEGKFYVFTKEETDSLLGENAPLFNDYYNISKRGNWEEHKNILHLQKTDEQVAKKNKLSVVDLQKSIEASKKILFDYRAKRIRPGLDDKVLTSWNALMLKGYVDAYRVFDEPDFLAKALKNGNFIVNKCMQKDGRLNRNYKDGKSSINAFLDDYSLTIEAFIALYQATFEEEWLHRAKKLADYVKVHFYDEKSGMYFYTSDLDKALIARKMELSDNVIAGSNSSMAKALFYLGTYYYNKEYTDAAKQMLSNVKPNIGRQVPFYSNWFWLMTHFVKTPYEVAIVGDDFKTKRKELDKHYLPNNLLLGGKTEGTLELLKGKLVEGDTRIYVCQNKVCKFPTSEVKKALELME